MDNLTNKIGGSPLTCGQQSARASSEESTGQNMDNGQWSAVIGKKSDSTLMVEQAEVPSRESHGYGYLLL